MPSYFQPLRRKIAVLTLMLACVFAAGWVRSLNCLDSVDLPVGDCSTTGLTSSDQLLVWSSKHFSTALLSPSPKWTVTPKMPMRQVFGPMESESYHCGFGYFEVIRDRAYQTIGWIIPYPFLVAPLMSISMWLLVSTPRMKKPPVLIPA